MFKSSDLSWKRGRSKFLTGETSLSGTPCRNICSTTLGDTRCKTCGRHQEEITKWGSLSETERKLINIRNAGEGYKIRQLVNQEARWEEVRNMRNKLDDMSLGDILKRVVLVSTTQGPMEKADHKCIEALNKIVCSEHDINKIKLTTVMSSDDLEDLRVEFES